MKREIGERVRVTTTKGVVVDGMIIATGTNGRPLPFYPDSTVTKYGNGSIGGTAWGYKVHAPIVDPETLLPRVDGSGRVQMGISYVEQANIA